MFDADSLGDLATFALMFLHFGEHLLGVLADVGVLRAGGSLLEVSDGHGVTFDGALGEGFIEFFAVQGFELGDFLLAFFVDGSRQRDVVFLRDAFEILLRFFVILREGLGVLFQFGALRFLLGEVSELLGGEIHLRRVLNDGLFVRSRMRTRRGGRG